MSVDWHNLLAREEVQTLLRIALSEDLGAADVTTESVFDGPVEVTSSIVSRSETVACALPLAAAVFRRIDSQLDVRLLVEEGESVAAGTAMMEIRGDVRSLLTAERTALNFLIRLCGIAQQARTATQSVPGDCRAKVYDTRKTTPGWRHLEKAAVKTGGGENHRFGLFDMVLIKDNHIAAAGSVRGAVQRAKDYAARSETRIPVQVEIDGLHQLDEALSADPDIILLDNFTLADMRTAVSRAGQNVELEASGGITPEVIADVARTGVHRISLGALTHTVQPADLGLDLPPAAIIERHEEVDSTMHVARERANADGGEGTTIVALSQREGRGRHGRAWHSPPGAGLWMTTILRPDREPFHPLGLVAGAAVLETVHRLGGTDARLKWPNDVMVNGRKLAGILLEADGPVVLVGVGLNVAATSTLDLPEDVAQRYVGLNDIASTRVDAEQVLAELLPILQRRYGEWCAQGLPRTLAFWKNNDVLAGQKVHAEAGGTEIEGVADGLDDDGALRVRVGAAIERVTAGEVTRVRPA